MRRVGALVVVAVAAVSCTGSGAADRSEVVASFYPAAFVARAVGEPEVDVADLTPAGAEPHDVELSVRQVAAVAEADLLLYVGDGFQPAVERVAADAGRAIDLLAAVERRAGDPHVWLDPVRMQTIAATVARALADVGEGHRGAFLRRAERLTARLERLDRAFRTGLQRCATRHFVTSHAAFGYLADRYGLNEIAVAGIDPEGEPSPRRLAEVARLVRLHDIDVIFFERLVPRGIADTIASETGARTAVLDPIESEPERGDYVDAMYANLRALRAGLRCR